MPGPILHVGDTMTCPHGGQVTTVPGSPRVMVSGMPVATMADASGWNCSAQLSPTAKRIASLFNPANRKSKRYSVHYTATLPGTNL
jgi:hypothetical protein